MIDQWFKNDLQNIYASHSVAVFIDESGDAEFLLKTVKNEYTIHQANSELEELHVKYLIEKAQPTSEKFLIYTRSKKEDLKFVREYCETNGCLEIRYLRYYIKAKVHQILNLNINLSNEELIAAAKVSVGKGRNYWLDLGHKGATEIFDLNKELLPFLHDPETYAKEKYDAKLRETFYRKVNELLGQNYLNKPASTLAGEVVKAMLDGLSCGNCDKVLATVYQSWLDSISFKNSFNGYLSKYSLLEGSDIWNADTNHPFRQIDEEWLVEIGNQLKDKSYSKSHIDKIRQRSRSKEALALGITFWSDVMVLIEFDAQNIAYLSSFNECVEFYTNHFYKLDTAIRNLYAEFLNKKQLLEPFQEYYKQFVSIFLDKWFKYFDDYRQTQTGILQRIINENNVKTAVIVGDGVAYEIACQVASKVRDSFKCAKNIILADFPSNTVNNMSRIYMDNGATEKIQTNREKYLKEQNPDISIDFIKLDEVSDDERATRFLLCTYKDIDDMGEKLQHKALKYFPETITYFAEKINLLLDNGYAKVYLITDHGFVLTGLLSNSEKISFELQGKAEKTERYIRSNEQQHDLKNNFVVKEEHGQYHYFSKTMNPFKTPGVYGFSHGGVCPQELITPYFCWELAVDHSHDLAVSIFNKDDLQNVTGELFQVKIKAGEGRDDLFTLKRKVYLVFFSNKVQINKSDVFTIQKAGIIAKEYTFDGYTEIEIQLLDAQTKELLDRSIIKQNKDRDLGGLL